MRTLVLALVLICLATAQPLRADALPPRGNELSAADRAAIQAGLDELTQAIASLRAKLADQPVLLQHLPDVELYATAVRYPLQYHEPIDPRVARKALADGMARARAMADGKTPWLLLPGPRGYVSRIDGSIQPYLLSPPTLFDPGRKYRVDLFLHGRDEGLMELKFLKGTLPPQKDKFLVHPYGRYCNANKFAGEIDTLEILDDLRKRYSIDENRIVLTGFSMGGASVWHLAVHYPDVWCAASPGAGFAETRRYLHLSQSQIAATPWYEQDLWHLYDATDDALNLSNLPLIAYAGEIDKQIQASDVMQEAMEKQGLRLERIIGPKTAHKYEPGAKKQLDQRLDEIASRGKNPDPNQIHFVTYTLRYNRCFWITLDALEHHWQEARIDAERTGNALRIKTANIAGFSIDHSPNVPVVIDGKSLPAGSSRFAKTAGGWQATGEPADVLRKRHALQGPIDDAFMEPFLFVKPSGHSQFPAVDAWASSECDRAIANWHGIFRGEVRAKLDTQITGQDIAENNLILWGDPASNALLARIAPALPVRFEAGKILCDGQSYDASTHLPLLIYPNPLNPARYVVLNSGFTFHDHSSNSRQIPKLPDYAIVDITAAPGTNVHGAVVQAGFFDEFWRFQRREGRP